jgi:hypothetical protein
MTLFAVWRLRIGAPVPVEQQAAYVTVPTSSPVALEMDPRTPDAEKPA